MFDPSYRGSLKATRLIPGGGYEKRNRRNEKRIFFGVSAVCAGKPFFDATAGGPGRGSAAEQLVHGWLIELSGLPQPILLLELRESLLSLRTDDPVDLPLVEPLGLQVLLSRPDVVSRKVHSKLDRPFGRHLPFYSTIILSFDAGVYPLAAAKIRLSAAETGAPVMR
jgi:hypothetical protein